MTVTQSSLLNKEKCTSVCVWALLTVEKWLEVRVNICALLRDVEVTGELVRELLTCLNDGALGKQRVDNNTFEFLLT